MPSLDGWQLRPADRRAVKVGIALLGLYHAQDDLALLLALGRHEEFTLYVSVALQNSLKNADRELWELAKHVTGWGRINLVERLADTRDAEIKAWLLREGFRNSIMVEYTALTCAQAGGLLAALLEPNPDDALLLGAGEIITALCVGCPGPGMRAYADGIAATELYLRHLLSRESRLTHFNKVSYIGWSLTRLDGEEGRDTSEWLNRRDDLQVLIHIYQARPDWLPLIHAGLANTDRGLFLEAA